MIKSMTGFGRSCYQDSEQSLSCEVKSINHRFLEPNLRLPRLFQPYELDIRGLLAEYLSRGKLELRLQYNKLAGDSVIRLDRNQASSWLSALRELAELCGSTSDPFAVMAQHSELFIVEQEEQSDETLKALLLRTVRESLEALNEMRGLEGANLARDLEEGLTAISDLREQIAARAPELAGLYRKRLLERLDNLLGEQRETYCDEQRVAAEIAIFADKADIHEELVRLASHVVQFRQILTEEGPVGKKLDFLIQEMNREANTIGSKANDLQITDTVIQLKSQIEKLREQIQNVE